MSKRTSTGKTKDKAPARDGPEGRLASRPTGRLVARPPCRLVSRPESASSGRGGRGGSRSASGNGDRLVDDWGDVGEYLDESRRPEGRPPNPPRYQPRDRPTCHLLSRPKGTSLGRGGRGGSSSASGNGDQFADDRGDVGEFLDGSFRPEGRTTRRGGGSSATREGDPCADDHGEYLDENMDELEMESSQPVGASLGRGGRGGSSSDSGNGDQFADDRGNIWEYLDEGVRASSRPVGRGDSICATREGDAQADNHGEYLEVKMLDMESWQHRRGSNIADTPHTQSSLKSWSDMIDREWQKKLKAGRENRLNIVYQHRLRMERGGPVSSHEVYQRSHMKRGMVSEYITKRAKNVTERYSDMMEEKYGADNASHRRVGDREIWERACGGPSKKGRYFGFGTSSTSITCSSSAHHSSIASSNEVESLKKELEDQAKEAKERELAAKKREKDAKEREREAEERVKEQVKEITKMLETLKPPPSPPPS